MTLSKQEIATMRFARMIVCSGVVNDSVVAAFRADYVNGNAAIRGFSDKRPAFCGALISRINKSIDGSIDIRDTFKDAVSVCIKNKLRVSPTRISRINHILGGIFAKKDAGKPAVGKDPIHAEIPAPAFSVSETDPNLRQVKGLYTQISKLHAEIDHLRAQNAAIAGVLRTMNDQLKVLTANGNEIVEAHNLQIATINALTGTVLKSVTDALATRFAGDISAAIGRAATDIIHATDEVHGNLATLITDGVEIMGHNVVATLTTETPKKKKSFFSGWRN